ncbi:R3H domain-containing 1-like [Olea europaea subsp. europaea]|uniref:R3H domain-containing 1-like n=1 Tax=Olea europaea subsp. europaea TaxID=158383 RepID=A0A8S0TPA2_OLEEU|nr:R3H domain-containing 1-like [Olea europaea subsp. europaea]
MEGPVTASEDFGAPPESWEVADVDASMRRLMLSSTKNDAVSSDSSSSNRSEKGDVSPSIVVSEDLVNSVDQFLREALQNPRERLSVLRIEQDVEKFIQDPTRDQMEFQQLPTSYLRLAAHRVAQHYSLQSMVLLDNQPDGSGSRIIVRKTSNIRLPSIRLADIPVNLPTEDGLVKFAIKQRPQKGSQTLSSNSRSSKPSGSKSVEERKEEYNRARARIFSSNSSSGNSNWKPENEHRTKDISQKDSSRISNSEERFFPGGGSDPIRRSLSDCSTVSSRSPVSRTEEPVGRFKTNNKVAIFRDREVDRVDPDYDRSYDRYMQRFDPGFGYNGGPYVIQPMYAPALNYNTEFPQLGSSHGPPISTEHQPYPVPQHLPGPWVAPSAPAGIGYGPPETMMTTFSPSHVGARTNSALYLHSAQYPCQRSGMPVIHPHEAIHQPFPQSYQQQHDASFGMAQPR